jgi:hypothetical protein
MASSHRVDRLTVNHRTHVNESVLDGIYVIRTSVSSENLSSSDAVRCYKQLSGVERAFRSMKTVDLKQSPKIAFGPGTATLLLST